MKRTRWMVVVVLFAAFLVTGIFTGLANAADYPQVGNLKPFTAETNYMSLPGYLRYLNFLQEKDWISRAEAVRIVKQQTGKAYAEK